MATAIKIKRATGDGAPATSDLIEGELAYAEDRSNNGASAKLYISSINSSSAEVIDTIGGKYYTAIVDGATNANTASKLVKRDGSGNFSAGTITANLTGNASGSSGSTTGNAATATALANARTIGGTSFDGTANIAVALSTEATNVTVTANNSANETVYPLFVDGVSGTQGAETDSGLTYNPSTGVLTTTSVTGNLTGNVTGNASGTAATVTTAAQTNITSLGTLTALTVDNVVIDGAVIGHTGDTDLITLSSGVVTVAGEVDATSLDVSGDADIDGTIEWGSLSDGAITITAFVDEDNMSTNSATLVPTQQSVKAYVDTQVATAASVDDATALAIALG